MSSRLAASFSSRTINRGLSLGATSSRRLNRLDSVWAVLAVVSIVLTGCSAIPASSNKNWSEFSEKVDAHGALPVMHHEFDILPLVEMLEGSNQKADCLIYKNNNELDPISYQCATQKFYARTRSLLEPIQRLERNRIQERILAISEDRCNAYKRYLRYDQSMSNFWLGFGSTLAGGLGALADTMTAAKTFSAFGGVLSGINAEYNQAFYGNLFYSVITKAIDEQRRDAYRQIQTYGQSKSLADYPVEAAIKDAILYDGTCSAVSAMEYAEKAVQLVNDPGMDGMMRYLIKANQSRYILQNRVKDISELKQAGITTTFENSRFGSHIGSKDELNPLTNIQSKLDMARQQTAKDIVETAVQQYADNDPVKLQTWNEANKAEIAKPTEVQLIKIVDGFRKSLSLCSESATQLYDDYLVKEAQLMQAEKEKKAEAQFKLERDQAQNKVEQINVVISGIAQHFQILLDDLTKSVSALVSSTPIGEIPRTLKWNYIEFDGTACVKFKPTPR